MLHSLGFLASFQLRFVRLDLGLLDHMPFAKLAVVPILYPPQSSSLIRQICRTFLHFFI